jgi:hypothetical protein
MPNEVKLNKNPSLNLNEVNSNQNSNENSNLNLTENSNKNDPRRDSYRTVLDTFCDDFDKHYLLDLYSSTEKIKHYKYENYLTQEEENRIGGIRIILNESTKQLLSNIYQIPLFIKDYIKVNEDIKKDKKYGPIQFYKASLQQLLVILHDNRIAVNNFTKHLNELKNQYDEYLKSFSDFFKNFKKNRSFKTYFSSRAYRQYKKEYEKYQKNYEDYKPIYERFIEVCEKYKNQREAWFDFLGSTLPDYTYMFPNSIDIPDNVVHVNGTSVENNAVPIGVPIGNLNKTSKGNIPKAKPLNYTRRTQRVQSIHIPRYGPISNESLQPQRIEKNNTFRTTLIERRRANEARRAIQSRPAQGIAMNG